MDRSQSPGGDSRPLSPLEEAILLSSRPDQPKVLAYLARTDGRIAEDRLRRAVGAALGRFPLARASLEEPGGTQLRWRFPATPDVDPVTLVRCRDEHDLHRVLEAACSSAPDLRVSPPVRVRLVRLPGGDAVALVAQHAAMDGIGGLRLLREIVDGYAGDGAGDVGRLAGEYEDAPDRSVDPGVGRERRHGVLHRLAAVAAGLRLRSPARVARVGQTRRAGYGLHAVSVPAADLAAIARGTGLTVNDLLVATLHRTIDRWNSEHGTPASTVRVRIPVTLRSSEDRWESVANATEQALVTTTPEDRRSGRDLIHSVAAQTRHIRDEHASAEPATSISLLHRLPAPIRQRLVRRAIALLRPRMMPTCTLSNLGRVDGQWSFGTGQPRVTGLDFVTVAGMPQGMSVAAVGYGDRVRLTFGHQWELLDRPAAAAFAGHFVDELNTLAG